MLTNRLKISDTLSMLSGYSKSGQSVKYSDTVSMLTNRLKISDTLNMLSGYSKSGQSVKYSDTASMLTNRLKISDTSNMLSGYSKSGQTARYSDTAAMIANRLKISDTALMLSKRLKISDTAFMLSVKAPLLSPALTGLPTAPTASAGTINTQIATTAFVNSAVLSATPPGTSLTGNTLASNILNSSLTSLGTLSNLNVSGNISGTLTTASQPNITTVGTLSNLTITGDLTLNGTVFSTNGLNASAASTSDGIGYTSNGGTVLQKTSKTTSVTINGYSGQITTNTSKINGIASASFVVNNSVVNANDVPFIAIASGGTQGTYQIQVDQVFNGGFMITISNKTFSTSNAESLVLNFVIFRGN
jgi:hypothetical protein